jgi:tetratricopeptide (TPR) repeat protein
LASQRVEQGRLDVIPVLESLTSSAESTEEAIALDREVARAYERAGKRELAEPRYGDLAHDAEEKVGAASDLALGLMRDRARVLRSMQADDEAVDLYRELLDRCSGRWGEASAEALAAKDDLAVMLFGAGRRDEALALFDGETFDRSTVVRADQPETAEARRWHINPPEGASARAVRLLEMALHGSLDSLYARAGELERQGRNTDSVAIFDQICSARAQQFGPDHRLTAEALTEFGKALHRAGAPDDAIAVLTHVVATYEKLGDVLGRATASHLLAGTLKAHGRVDEAVEQYNASLGARAAELGPFHPQTLTVHQSLAVTLEGAGRFDEALPHWQAKVEAYRALLGEDDADALFALLDLANCHALRGDLDVARSLFTEALDRCSRVLGENDSATQFARERLQSLQP